MHSTKIPDAAGRILLADDEDVFLEPTALFFRTNGYECDCVRDAEQAAEALARSPYDLLIIDIHMPGNTNLEFLRDRPQYTSFIPVIVVTGNPTLHTAVESLRLAVVDYQSKPLHLPEFLATVKNVIEKAKVIRVMRDTRQGLVSWLDRIKQMETTLLSPPDYAGPAKKASGELDWYLGEAMQGFANISLSLMSAMQALNRDGAVRKADMCYMMNCSRLSAYEDGIRNAVDVLIKTKNSFKSKDLAEVRKNLESLLESGAGRG